MTRRKIPRRISSGIIGVLVVWVLVGLGVVGAVVSTPIVEEPLGENSAQTIAVGDEVVGLRTETSKTHYLGNSTYRLISTGPLHYEDEQGDWQQIDNAIVGGQMLKDAYHLSIIQEDFDEGQVLEWSVEGEYVRFQPMALGWTNNDDMWDEISMPQAVTSSVVNTSMPLLEEGDGYSQGKVVWGNAYGTGRNFQWTSTPHKLEKLLTLDTAPPAPPQYIIDGGNPVLRLSFIFDTSADLDIYIDGALWDKNTKVMTFSAIEFKKDGETLWVFNPISCWDATGETQIGKTTLRRVGSDLWVDVLVPYEWLQTASYPVYIDPTLEVLISTKDCYMVEGLPTTPNGGGVSLVCGKGLLSLGKLRPLVEFSISGLPAEATITTATMSLYYYYKSGTPAGNTHYAYRLLRRDWVEAQATWDIYKTGSSWTTAGASGSGTDYTATAGASTVVPADYGWMNWAITDQVITAYDNSWTVDCRIHSSDEVTEETASYHSKEYTDDTSRRPKLVIDYTVPPTVTTSACSGATASSLQANGEVTDDGGGTIFRRGFSYMEGDSGTPPDQIIMNGHFEKNTDDWILSSGTLVRDTGTKYLGTASGKLSSLATGSALWKQSPTEVIGRTVTFKSWCWSTHTRAYIFVQYYTDAWYGGSDQHSGSSSWEHLSVTIAIPDTATDVRALIYISSGGTPTGVQSAWFDGIVLGEGANPLYKFDEDDTFGQGVYDLTIEGLTAATNYRVRAFAENEAGVGYGDVVTCQTAAGYSFGVVIG